MFKGYRSIALLSIDIILIVMSVYMSYLLRFDFNIDPEMIPAIPYVIVFQVVATICCLYYFKIYKRLWEYASIGDLLSIVKAITSSCIIFFTFHHLVIHYFYPNIIVPRTIYVMSGMISILFIGGSRFIWRLIRHNNYKLQAHHRKALIVGAGKTGNMVVNELFNTNSEYYPVAFVDDDVNKYKLEISNIPVLGNRKDIPQIVESLGIEYIILAMPSVSKAEVAEIITICKTTECKIKIIPRMNDLINGKISVNMIRNVSVEDLLGREPINLNLAEIASYLSNKVVLVTGAGGSIGSELCRQIINFTPKQLLLLGHGENSIYDIEMELKSTFKDIAIMPIIADIQDKGRISDIFKTYKPEVVFHAAAHKHVPLMEANPFEAIKNNVMGTMNVAECAHQSGTNTFVMISTDKAVNPTNVMGATKRIAEMFIQALDKTSKTQFVAVRFGNVLGSRGSVIPVFKKQIEMGGPVTVTHPNMIRYFMTIPEAVQLVIQTGALASGGEIFILDMGKPVRISDLAIDLIRLSGLEPHKDIKIIYTGIRPGEKLFEEILTSEEGSSATKHDRIFIGRPSDISIEQIRSLIDRLTEKAPLLNRDEIVILIKQIVPTYKITVLNEIDTSLDLELKASLELVATVEGKVNSQ